MRNLCYCRSPQGTYGKECYIVSNSIKLEWIRRNKKWGKKSTLQLFYSPPPPRQVITQRRYIGKLIASRKPLIGIGAIFKDHSFSPYIRINKQNLHLTFKMAFSFQWASTSLLNALSA